MLKSFNALDRKILDWRGFTNLLLSLIPKMTRILFDNLSLEDVYRTLYSSNNHYQTFQN